MKDLIVKFFAWLSGLGEDWSGRVAHGTWESEDFPYLTFRQVPLSDRERETGGTIITRIAWELNLWHTNQSACATQMDTLVDALEALKTTDLVLTAGQFVRADVQDSTVMEDPDRTSEGDIVWRGLVSVELLMRK